MKSPGNLIINIAVFFLVAIASTAIYFNSLNNGFHFDDIHHIVNNAYIRSLKNIPLFFVDLKTFSIYELTHYRPLLLVSHALNYYFGRLNPVGFHIGNLILHVGTAFLVFLVVQTMLDRKKTFIAVSAALIFALHPFNSEAVNYISARSSVMGSFFYLLAFYCWVRFRQAAGSSKQLAGVTPTPSLPRRGGGRKGGGGSPAHCSPLTAYYYYIASLLAFGAGMLTKEIVITLPIVLWLYDLYFAPSFQDNRKKVAAESHPYWRYIRDLPLYMPYIFLVAIPYILMRLYLAGPSISVPPESPGYYFHLLMEAKVLVKYFYLLFFPVNLSVEHAIFEVTSMLEPKVFGSILFLLFVIGLCVYLSRSHDLEWRVVSFFIPWFFISMLLTIVIPLNAPLQENRAYLASAGYAVFLGTIVDRFALKSHHRGALRIAALISILFLYSIGTMDRNTIWKDDLSLWLDAVHKSPQAWRAHYNLAHTYEKLGLEDMALPEYRKTAEIRKDYPKAINRIGNIYYRKGQMESALAEYKKAVSISPMDTEIRMNLARTYLKLGQRDLAREEWEKVIKVGKLLGEENEDVEEARSYLLWLKSSPHLP